MPANCNFGIKKSTFPYVAILHDGDRFKPDLISQWFKAITENESVGFVFNTVGVTADASEEIVSSTVYNYEQFEEGVVKKEHLLNNIYFRSWRFFSPVYGEAMISKSLLEEKGFFKKKYGFYADVDFWMDVLQTHDAYFCKDTLITGPAKTVQPRLFEDNPVRYFIYMFNMQFDHRKRAYKGQPLKLAKELLIFWFQAFFGFNYWLLVIIKNFSFQYFFDVAQLFQRNVLFLISWTMMLLLYPFICPFLKLVKAAKNIRLRPQPLKELRQV
jgi:hypothetical protein